MEVFTNLINEEEKILHRIYPEKWPMLLGPAVICTLLGIFGLVMLFIEIAVGIIVLLCSIIIWSIVASIYNKCAYCITDKRIIVVTGRLIGRDWRFIDLESITTVDIAISLSDRIINGDAGSGTLIFYNDSNPTNKLKGGFHKNAFLHILDPIKWQRTVGSLVTKAR